MAIPTESNVTSPSTGKTLNSSDNSGTKSGNFPTLGSFWFEVKALNDEYKKTVDLMMKSTYEQSDVNKEQMDALNGEIRKNNAAMKETDHKKGLKKGGFWASIATVAIVFAGVGAYVATGGTAAALTAAIAGKAMAAGTAAAVGGGLGFGAINGYTGALMKGELNDDGSFDVKVLDDDEIEELTETVKTLGDFVNNIQNEDSKLMSINVQDLSKLRDAILAYINSIFDSKTAFTNGR